MYFIGEVENNQHLKETWGCEAAELPDTYLGAALGAGYKCKQIWTDIIDTDIIDRFNKRLGMWKRKFLSEGGRIVLIKSTLNSLPAYLLSIFTIPVKVADKLEQIMRNFLWGTTTEARRYHLISWE